ncbi:diguanylate cyclase [Quadrisphaera sp. DSM 44207]|uniref:GGDEF domain-containing protein n=1 Tax=Quadrisphaera sp. DSM 44207 TaxID=1881057 RepID=UPI00088F2F17|nr:GGDEF domain-containing protein [Quadrisphaera sp. DSM 44207]SDQ46531.1 diguanylate cyclase (GGDEF) domain-containing protein [Quadrisphaera sp. DSM 44207]
MTSEAALLELLRPRARGDLEPLAPVAVVLEAGTPCPVVERVFGEDERLDAVVVRDAGGTRHGVLSRRDFELVMGGRFGYGRSLNHRRPVGDLATWDVPVLPAGSDVVTAAAAAGARAAEHRFDDLLLQGADGALRVLPAAAVLEALAADYARRATHDPLTGLPNRELLFGRLAEALAVPSPRDAVVVSYLDVVGLGPVNRRLGHDAGDAVLVRVAEALRACAEDDEVVAHVGGDEFAVLTLVRGDRASDAAARAAARATRFGAAVREAFTEDVVPVRASAGAAVARPGAPGADAGSLLRAATSAMSTAQRWGSQEAEVVELDDAGQPTAWTPTR